MHSTHRFRILTLLSLSSLLALAGCNGFFTPRTDNTTTSNFAFVANSNFAGGGGSTAGTVSIFKVDSSTGILSATLSPISTGGTIANSSVSIISVLGKFLYTANDGGSVSGFTWDTKTGNLIAISGSPFPAGTNPTALIADRSGKFLFVANSGSNNISVYTINATTGALTAATTATVSLGANTPLGLAIHPSLNVLYAAIGTSGIAVLNYDGTTGAVTFLNNVAPLTGGNSQGITIAKSGNFAYVANGLVSGGVEAWKLNASGNLTTPVQATPYAAHDTPVEVVIDPTGGFLVALNNQSNDVSMYSVNTSTGILTPNSANPINVYTSSSLTPALSHITFDPTGNYVYVTVLDSTPSISGSSGVGLPGVIEFKLNTTSNALTKVPPSSTVQGVQAGNNPAGIVLP